MAGCRPEGQEKTRRRGGEPLRVELVDTLVVLFADGHEGGFFENPQVLGDGGLADRDDIDVNYPY